MLESFDFFDRDIEHRLISIQSPLFSSGSNNSLHNPNISRGLSGRLISVPPIVLRSISNGSN